MQPMLPWIRNRETLTRCVAFWGDEDVNDRPGPIVKLFSVTFLLLVLSHEIIFGGGMSGHYWKMNIN